MLSTALLVALAASATTEDERLIVAVFPIQDSSTRLQANALDQLTDYLGVKITQTGTFYVVPQKDIDAALRGAKTDSYRDCYDQACQIEIGNELAAQKILHTQIVQVGDHCAVTATLYDLRLAVTDRATAHKAGCTENELVASLETVAQQLTITGVAPPTEVASAVTATQIPSGPQFGLKLTSEPEGADVIVDGKFIGQTPARVSLSAEEAHRVTVQRDGYVDYSEELELTTDAKRTVQLRLTPEARSARTEWFGLSAAASVSFSGALGGGLWLRIANFQFGRFSWTVAEGYLGFVATREFDDEFCTAEEVRARGFCERGETGTHVALGTRPGWTFNLDEDGVHALEASLGFGLFAVTSGVDESTAVALSPSIRYLRRGDRSFVYGAGLRALVPLSSETCDSATQPFRSYVECRYSNPFTIQVEVPFGWYR